MTVIKGKLHRLKQRKSNPVNPTEESLGTWKLESFELDLVVCELRYESNAAGDYGARPSKHADGYQVCGVIQSSTEVRRGPRVMLDSSAGSENDGPQRQRQAWVHMFEVVFFIDNLDRIEDHTVVLGHVDQGGRERWVKAIESLIVERRNMCDGFESFFSNRQMMAKEEREWLEKKAGQYVEHINRDIWKQARLRNKKVFKDLERVFMQFSEDKEEMSASGYKVTRRLMSLDTLLTALDELGVEYFGAKGDRLLDRIRREQGAESEGVLNREQFDSVFKQCFEDRMKPPSLEMQERLFELLYRSNNVFLKLLSDAEKHTLVEGADSSGQPNCSCQSWTKGSVLVKQGDSGDSMYCVVEGELSVLVSFGSTEKEVATLGAGAVLGEMSLVFGKPRSATCAVASAECVVAEIRHSAMSELLRQRPMLQRELYEISVHREIANNRTKAFTVLDSDFGIDAPDSPPPQNPDDAPPAALRQGHEPATRPPRRPRPQSAQPGPSFRPASAQGQAARQRLVWLFSYGRAGIEMDNAQRQHGWSLRTLLDAPTGDPALNPKAPAKAFPLPPRQQRPASASARLHSPAPSLAASSRRPSSPSPASTTAIRRSVSLSNPGSPPPARAPVDVDPVRPHSSNDHRRRLPSRQRSPSTEPSTGGRAGSLRKSISDPVGAAPRRAPPQQAQALPPKQKRHSRRGPRASERAPHALMQASTGDHMYKVQTAKWVPTGQGLGFKVTYD